MNEENQLRRVLRTLFTKECNSFIEFLTRVDEADKAEVTARFSSLKTRYSKLSDANDVVLAKLMDKPDLADEELSNEFEKCSEYELKYLTAQSLCDEYLNQLTAASQVSIRSTTSEQGECGNQDISDYVKHKFKPEITKKFDGTIGAWIGFWTQFVTIHESPKWTDDEKFDILLRALKPGSPAQKLIDRFPPSRENYVKAVDLLKNRFGKDEYLIEFYVRQLLSLVLTRSADRSISELYDELEVQLSALDTLKVTTEKYAAMLFPLVESAVPEDIFKIWERHRVGKEASMVNPADCLTELLNFLKVEVAGEERLKLRSSSFCGWPMSSSVSNGPRSDVPTAASLLSTGSSHGEKKRDISCLFCENPHASQDCFKAMDMSYSERLEIVRKRGGCFKCLRKAGHLSSACKVFTKCAVCKGRHFPIMCQKLEEINEASDSLPIKPEITKTLLTSCIPKKPVTYLQTLIATINFNDRELKVRVLLDSGSQKSYIIKSCVKELKLSRSSKILVRQEVFGGRRSSLSSHGVYHITLKSLDKAFECDFEVLDQDRISNFVPKLNDVKFFNLLKARGITLSDFSEHSTYDSQDVQILLGADSWAKIITPEHVQLESGMVAINTKLGWTLLGTSNDKTSVTTSSLVTLTCHTHLANLWDLELLGIRDPAQQLTQEQKDRQVDEFFERTVRIKDGRYWVNLPWIEGHTPLEDNRDSVLGRLITTTRKLREINQFEAYDSVIQGWISEGIVEVVPEEEVIQSGHYLPHRAVFKEGSTTRIRPVFDASNRDKNGNCLNQSLEKGPNLIELIPKILIKFRLGKFGTSADIEKAFLQIALDQRDRNFLRFLWWKDGQVIELRHCRVVFGVSPSPYLLGAVLQHLLRHADPDLQNTALRLRSSFYVDNCLTSLDSPDELDIFTSESKQILSAAGFNLRGWVSNLGNPDQIENVLGLKWYCSLDALCINLKPCMNVPKPLTRRVLLSLSQRLYDPIGFTAPVSLIPKVLLQRSWSNQAKWDDPLSKDLCEEFNDWIEELPYLEDCKLPRRIIWNDMSTLHIFCDASKDSYAACVFIRTKHENDVFVNLVMAKSRVAPTKALTIPRLELMAALIGVRLFKLVGSCFNIDLSKTVFWSDSSVVISWLKKTGPWSVFVKNRVEEIKAAVDHSQWRHIPGNENPADLISRGCTSRQLARCRWWEGPTWLYGDEESWPRSEVELEEVYTNQERRKTVVTALTTQNSEFSLLYFTQKFSSYYFIVKVIMHVLDATCIICPRFLKFCGLDEDSVLKRGFTSKKFMNSELVLFHRIQEEYFDSNVKKSALKGYSVFKDERGLLRIQSRILDNENTEEFNAPVVLPGKHPLVLRMIEHLHLVNNHAGVLTLLMILRERIWLLSGRQAVGMTVRKCITCRRNQARALQVPIPPLPTDRTNPSSTFQVTGVDLAGPLFLKDHGKAWVVIFTCAVYRAIHLDLVLSLSTATFIQALRRFIARRGRPLTIYSDNGSNFIGLNNLFKQIDWNVVEEEAGILRIQWKFNPPTASWWGGFWERLIRILKDLLRKNLGNASLMYEEMMTLLCECESIMNNRPLTYLSEDPTELTPLRPSMFLHALSGNDTEDLDQIDRNSLERRWNYLQEVREGLKKRFCKEYLGILRSSRPRKIDTLQIGDIVLVVSDNKRRLEWPLARVIDLFPGRDGITRLAKLKTQNGEVLRPLQRLYPLEVHEGALDHPAGDSALDPDEYDGQLTDENEQLPCDTDSEDVLGVDVNMDQLRDRFVQTRAGRIVKPREILNL